MKALCFCNLQSSLSTSVLISCSVCCNSFGTLTGTVARITLILQSLQRIQRKSLQGETHDYSRPSVVRLSCQIYGLNKEPEISINYNSSQSPVIIKSGVIREADFDWSSLKYRGIQPYKL